MASAWKPDGRQFPWLPRAPRAKWTCAFVERLGELGWIESRTIAIKYRWAEGHDERYRTGADVTGGTAR